MKNRFVVSLVLLLGLLNCSPADEGKQESAQSESTLDIQVQVKVDYLLYLPEDYESNENPKLYEWLLEQKREPIREE